jgi:tripartite-type tricarboxylate transporter receptor subunit TctC
VARSFSIVVVNPKSDIRSIKDLIATAKAAPDKLSYGTYGTGTSAHLWRKAKRRQPLHLQRSRPRAARPT